MSFTKAQLATQIHSHQSDLQNWCNTNQLTQGPHLVHFIGFFNGLQTWITQQGGANPFGWDNAAGLTENNGIATDLSAPHNLGLKVVINDAFNDTRKFLNTPNFLLFKSAENFTYLCQAL